MTDLSQFPMPTPEPSRHIQAGGLYSFLVQYGSCSTTRKPKTIPKVPERHAKLCHEVISPFQKHFSISSPSPQRLCPYPRSARHVCHRRRAQAVRTTAFPTPRLITHAFTLLFPLPASTNLLTWSAVYFFVTTLLTERPVETLSSSCAEIQHFAIKFCAISKPPGVPELMLPPRYHGFCTWSKECKRQVNGSAAFAIRWEVTYG